MPRGSDTARCAICGRTEGSVELLASASGTLLCTDCAGRMGERVVTAHARRHRPLPTAVPRDIKRVLDDYVIEQEDA
jgi:ATP-dependent protease Clp ATPase subunit